MAPPVQANRSDERVLIMAPVGRDAIAMSAVLARQGFQAQVCATVAECADEISAGAGVLLLTEEALEVAQLGTLLNCLESQPPWSELPVIILTSGGESHLLRLLDLIARAARSTTLLERPMSRATLLRSLEVARHSRRRQYQVRDLLEEQRAAHERLQLSEARLNTILAHAPIGLSEISLEGRFLRVNAELARIVGIKEADLLEKAVHDVTFAADLEKTSSTVERVLATGEPVSVDKRCLRPDGTHVWTQSTATRLDDEHGQPRSLLVVTADLTARLAAEEALRASEERFRLVVENAREFAIFTMDLDRGITSWSPGAEGILGYREGEVIGQLADIIFTPEDRAACAPEAEARIALAQGAANDERWHQRKDGTRLWGSGAMMPMRNAAQEVIGFVKIFRDRTASREVREALQRSREELWEALQETERSRSEAEEARAAAVAAGQAKDHFLAVLSHELRTPLMPVTIATRMLSRRKDLPPFVLEAVAMISRNVMLEARLVDDLLDITKISRGKIELLLAPMDLHEAVSRAVEISQSDFEAHDQRLTVRLEAAEHHLEGDLPRLQQVVWNLLKNASKFTPKAGSIFVRTWNEPGFLLAEVKDSGIGIEAEAIHRIFDAFTQADVSITRQFGGLGLGLAIAKSTVAGHGGELRVHSDGPGQGATFTIALPLLRPVAPAPPDAAAQPG